MEDILVGVPIAEPDACPYPKTGDVFGLNKGFIIGEVVPEYIPSCPSMF